MRTKNIDPAVLAQKLRFAGFLTAEARYSENLDIEDSGVEIRDDLRVQICEDGGYIVWIELADGRLLHRPYDTVPALIAGLQEDTE